MSFEAVTSMQKRRCFISFLEGENQPTVAEACRHFGISRKCAYKWIGRYRQSGEAGLEDLSRASHRHPNQIGEQMEQMIIAARHAHPSWGAKKILPWLRRKNPRRLQWPCLASVCAVLERNQLTVRRKRTRKVAVYVGPLRQAAAPNDVWRIDHKGWWLALNGDKCEPFTITDGSSRFLIRCVLDKAKGIDYVWPVLLSAFHEYGLPKVIRSDNGPPFASRAAMGLSVLTLSLYRLGIIHERITPGKPQENGGHERMHLTMLQDATQTRGCLRSEQRRLNQWRDEYNYERPHESLQFKTPGDLYVVSPRRMPGHLPQISYPPTMKVRKVDSAGQFCWNWKMRFLSDVFKGQSIGLEATQDPLTWTLWFSTMRLGTINENTRKVTWDKIAPAKTA